MTVTRDAQAATETDASTDIARAVLSVRWEHIPAREIEAVKKLILDNIGCAIAGSQEPGCLELLDLMREFGGSEQARVIGTGERLPVTSALAVNATMARALEIDDVSERALTHPSVTVVPTALAAAEYASEPISGKDFLAACVLGIDISNRLAYAPQLSIGGDSYRPKGMSSTYQIGTMAAALVAARLWKLDLKQTENAIGLAYSHAAGNQQGLLNGALSVRVQQGLSASSGILAALLAARGVTGPADPLEGKFGYFPTFWGGGYSRKPIVDGLGKTFMLADEVSIKPYPCCKYTHTAISAALQARGNRRICAEEVRRVVVHVNNAEYYSVVCDPIQEKQRPQTTVDAQFSIYYSVAVALLGSSMDIADFQQPLLGDPHRLALAQKVEAVVDPDATGEGRVLPTPGHVVVEFVDGTVSEGHARVAPGHPDAPLDWAGILTKFRSVTSHPEDPFPADDVAKLADIIRSLERSVNVADDVFALLRWRSTN